MIQAKDLSFCYGSKGATVLDNINLNLSAGKVCGLLGKNGAGKSTLINIMSGLLFAKSGDMKVLGHDASARNAESLADFFLVPDEINIPDARISKFANLFEDFYPNFSRDVLADCLKEFEVNGDPRLMKMSLGERKKAYISLALATQAHLLVMDEPTNGLDIPSKAQFRKLVSRYMSDDRLFIISTHQVHDVQPILDYIVILDNHKVALSQSIENIAQSYVFDHIPVSNPNDGVLYSEPSAGGNAVILHRTPSDSESVVNVELLFNAIISGSKL